MRTRHGFTLIELTVTLAITSIILGALGSVFVLSTSALPGGRSAQTAQARVEISVALSRLNEDVLVATGVRKATPTSIALTLPDRTGDGEPETVTWAWAGSLNGPLTRTENSDAPETVLPQVTSLSLTYMLLASTPGSSGVPVVGSEVLVASGGSESETSTAAVTLLASIAQSFRVSLPSDAISWTPSRVRVRARSSGLIDGSTDIQLRNAVSGTISIGGSTLFSSTLNESTLSSSGAWLNVMVSGVAPMPAGGIQRLAVVLAHRSGIESMRAFVQSGPQPVGSDYYTGNALLGTWVDGGARSLVYELYARVTTAPPPGSATHRLTSVGVSIATDHGSLRTTMLMPNTPGVIP